MHIFQARLNGSSPEAMVVIAIVSFLGGLIASVSGFGIGSIITPLFSLRMETKLAVAAVSIPHFVGTAIRCAMLRRSIDGKVLFGFGLASAAGGLMGALIHNLVLNSAITLVFGGILIVAGLLGASGLSEKLRFHGGMAFVAGGLSGLLGGMVGNQGGIRSAALLGFPLDKRAFVANGHGHRFDRRLCPDASLFRFGMARTYGRLFRHRRCLYRCRLWHHIRNHVSEKNQ